VDRPSWLKQAQACADPAGMRELDSATPRSVTSPGLGWTQLLFETGVLAVVSLLLLVVATLVPDHRSDAGFLFFLVLVLHAFAVGRYWIRAETFLSFECPGCSEPFHGFPERLPLPYRKHCAGCGERL
jgi:hypothetical protein